MLNTIFARAGMAAIAVLLCGASLCRGQVAKNLYIPVSFDPEKLVAASSYDDLPHSSAIGALPVTPPSPMSYVRRVDDSRSQSQPNVDWKPLAKDSLQFLVVMNAFRVATEPGTRDALHNPLFSGYVAAISNLHGWDDGDPFYVNYIGHPMQGAVSSFLWTNRDPAFNRDHFGWDSNYAKSKLRAGAYAYILSMLFEIGPLSEASIGQIQRYHPANGFIDHVVTPTVGVLWSVGEDAIDDSLIRSIENRTDNTVLRILARSTLNPAHSFANLMGRHYPWYRANRPGPSQAESAQYFEPAAKNPVSPLPGVAPFQFNVHMETRWYLGKHASDPCIGGGAELGFRIADNWQIAGEVTGCKQTGMEPNFSGDTLTYAMGPQWTGKLSSRWVTHARLRMGGNKVSQEQFLPDVKTHLLQKYGNQEPFPPLGNQYTKAYDNNAFAVGGGTGFDYKLNRALLFRSSLDYLHTWNRNINDVAYRDSFRFSSGFVLELGNW